MRTSGQRPFIVHFSVAEDVRISIVRSNAKVQVVRPTPLIFDRFDKQNDIAQPKLNRALAGFVA
jgi:hypothetical protein